MHGIIVFFWWGGSGYFTYVFVSLSFWNDTPCIFGRLICLAKENGKSSLLFTHCVKVKEFLNALDMRGGNLVWIKLAQVVIFSLSLSLSLSPMLKCLNFVKRDIYILKSEAGLAVPLPPAPSIISTCHLAYCSQYDYLLLFHSDMTDSLAPTDVGTNMAAQ